MVFVLWWYPLLAVRIFHQLFWGICWPICGKSRSNALHIFTSHISYACDCPSHIPRCGWYLHSFSPCMYALTVDITRSSMVGIWRSCRIRHKKLSATWLKLAYHIPPWIYHECVNMCNVGRSGGAGCPPYSASLQCYPTWRTEVLWPCRSCAKTCTPWISRERHLLR